MSRRKMTIVRQTVTINFPMDLYNRLIDEANKDGLNITSEVIILLNIGLNSKNS